MFTGADAAAPRPARPRRSPATTGDSRWGSASYRYTPSGRATYRSISCELLADAAVLPGLPNEPISRFTPKAAQSKFDRTWAGSSWALILRVVFRSLRAASTDLPPSVSGFGSVMGFRSRVLSGLPWAKPEVVLANTVKAGRVFTNVLRFIECSYGWVLVSGGFYFQ